MRAFEVTHVYAAIKGDRAIRRAKNSNPVI